MMLALGCIPWRGKLPCWLIWFIIELKDGDCPWRLKPPCIGGPWAGYVCPYSAAFWSIITAASWPWKISCLASKACPLNIKHKWIVRYIWESNQKQISQTRFKKKKVKSIHGAVIAPNPEANRGSGLKLHRTSRFVGSRVPAQNRHTHTQSFQ